MISHNCVIHGIEASAKFEENCIFDKTILMQSKFQNRKPHTVTLHLGGMGWQTGSKENTSCAFCAFIAMNVVVSSSQAPNKNIYNIISI